MALVTGTPEGSIITQDDIYIDHAPNVYIQEYPADELHNPDADGFYWGLSGTTAYPVYELGCIVDVTLGENLTLNQIRCDTVGDKATVQKRNYLNLQATVKTLFPLSVLRHLLKASPVTASGGLEKMGIGQINNNLFYHVYMPVVYDEDTGDYLSITGHKAQLVEAFELPMRYGDGWSIRVNIRMSADSTKPSAQQFATVIRADPSALP